MKIEEIFETVEKATGVPSVEFIKGGRRRSIVDSRFLCYKIMRDMGITLSEIGRVFNMHHTSILHGLNKFDNLIKSGDDRLIGYMSSILKMEVKNIQYAFKVVYSTQRHFIVYDKIGNEITSLSEGIAFSRGFFYLVCSNSLKFFIENEFGTVCQLERKEFIKLFTILK